MDKSNSQVNNKQYQSHLVYSRSLSNSFPSASKQKPNKRIFKKRKTNQNSRNSCLLYYEKDELNSQLNKKQGLYLHNGKQTSVHSLNPKKDKPNKRIIEEIKNKKRTKKLNLFTSFTVLISVNGHILFSIK